MITEFFGLSNTGKSVLKKRLSGLGYLVFHTQKASFLFKTFYFFKFFLIHSLKTFYLFYILNTNRIKFSAPTFKKQFQICKMRNFYLAFVLAKVEYLKNKTENIFIDEFSFQSLFMILQKKSNESEIKKILKKLPKSDYLFLFEGKREWRYNAYQKKHPVHSGTLLPGSRIDRNYAGKWMEIMEYNFKIIKKIILEDYQEDKEAFKELKLNYPKIYKRK